VSKFGRPLVFAPGRPADSPGSARRPAHRGLLLQTPTTYDRPEQGRQYHKVGRIESSESKGACPDSLGWPAPEGETLRGRAIALTSVRNGR
jgi:hypothetical protein